MALSLTSEGTQSKAAGITSSRLVLAVAGVSIQRTRGQRIVPNVILFPGRTRPVANASALKTDENGREVIKSADVNVRVAPAPEQPLDPSSD